MNLILPGDASLREKFADEESIRAQYWHPAAGETVLDIGSYLGSYALPALAAGADVLAVEPFTVFSDQMTEIARVNAISTARLTVVNEALSGPGGYSEEFWQHLAASPWTDIYATLHTPFTTLDALAARLGLTRLDWVKIDVEGAELGVLQGGRGTLARFRPFLLIEDHGDVYPFVAAMDSPRLCLELLRSLGYAPEVTRYAGHATPARDFWVCRP